MRPVSLSKIRYVIKARYGLVRFSLKNRSMKKAVFDLTYKEEVNVRF